MAAYFDDPWTEAQWTLAQEAVRDEARKVRVAASFLPIDGPVPREQQSVELQQLLPLPAIPGIAARLEINDAATRPLTSLSVNVSLSRQQVADPRLSSAMLAFRRAATVIARTEDHLVFRGQPPGLPAPIVPPCNITGGAAFPGLWNVGLANPGGVVNLGMNPIAQALVAGISRAITILEGQGHMGPFAAALNPMLFDTAHTPNAPALVLPADRIKPLLDGPLLRTSHLPMIAGVPAAIVVSLAGELLDLVVGEEISVASIQATAEAATRVIYRVAQRFTLRIKQPTAVVALTV
jgi:uncharacterized linocin/CFP29 family protein